MEKYNCTDTYDCEDRVFIGAAWLSVGPQTKASVCSHLTVLETANRRRAAPFYVRSRPKQLAAVSTFGAKVQSDQALLRIVTPTAVVRISAGINHRRGGKTDRFGRDLPELDFWQMGVGVEGLSLQHESLSGLLGVTSRVVVDPEGNEVMEGANALPGTISDYRVSDAEDTDFALLHT